MAGAGSDEGRLPEAGPSLDGSDSEADAMEQGEEDESMEAAAGRLKTSAAEGEGQFDNYLRVNIPSLREKPAVKQPPAQVPPALMDLVLGTSTAVSASVLPEPASNLNSRQRPDDGEDVAHDESSEDSSHSDSEEAAQTLMIEKRTERELREDASSNCEDRMDVTRLSTGSSDVMEREWGVLQAQRQAAESAVHLSVVQAAARSSHEVQTADSAEWNTEFGYIGDHDYEMLTEAKRQLPSRPTAVPDRQGEDDLEREWLALMGSRIPTKSAGENQDDAAVPPPQAARSSELHKHQCEGGNRDMQVIETRQKQEGVGASLTHGTGKKLVHTGDLSENRELGVNSASKPLKMQTTTSVDRSVGVLIVLNCDYDKVPQHLFNVLCTQPVLCVKIRYQMARRLE